MYFFFRGRNGEWRQALFVRRDGDFGAALLHEYRTPESHPVFVLKLSSEALITSTKRKSCLNFSQDPILHRPHCVGGLLLIWARIGAKLLLLFRILDSILSVEQQQQFGGHGCIMRARRCALPSEYT